MPPGINPFSSDSQLCGFADEFLRRRSRGVRKDINICLRQNREGKHAYFPALQTCVAHLDMLASFHSGHIKGHGFPKMKDYVAAFMDTRAYADRELALLYYGIRNKVAHQTHPQFVIDTANEPNIPGPDIRAIWTVYASRRPKPLELLPEPPGKTLKTFTPPWPVAYDHHFRISIRRLHTDIAKSINGPNGYRSTLRSSRDLREKFAKVIESYFPQ